ncbi:MAG TPA: YkgJ family cysteine cluster protein [Catalimonadaceae bacterium]|nr:YkgJ family cysteine cluster protein [Catalimonadaceae bacterium]HPI10228.1 YkgJ family cysteine cluster protein [Catalimonadaceae bacterium]
MNESKSILSDWKSNANRDFSKNKIFLKRISRSLPAISALQEAHDAVFEKMDCLECGNCCKSSSPVFNRTDINRISAFVGMKAGVFESTYLVADSDGDFIPKSKPCPFLEPDNTCQVYELRPKSCRGYPHTDTKEGWERHALLAGNTVYCPAAYRIVNQIRALSGG